jgi:arsenite methyltransferase
MAVRMTATAAPWDPEDSAVASAFDELPLWAAPFGLRLLEAVALGPDLVVLDVGFGAGFPLLELARRLGPSSRVYGVDPWLAGALRTHAKARTYGLDNVVPLLAVAERIPLRSGRVDLLVSNNGLNNVQDLQAALGECRRVCKAGAQLVITQNLPDSMRSFYDAYESVLRECGLDFVLPAVASHIHSKRRPLAEMRAHLSAAGFAVERTEESAFALRFLDGTALFRHSFVRLGFFESWRAVCPGPERDRVFSLLETRLNQAARAKGGLRLEIPFVCLEGRARA